MLGRVLLSLIAGLVTGVAILAASVGTDLMLRPRAYDGSAGMYGFMYGLILAPVGGILTAVLMGIWLTRRAKRAAAAQALLLS